MHKLLVEQFKKAKQASDDGEVDLEQLLQMVNQTYETADLEERPFGNSGTEGESALALQESEKKYRTLFDQIADPVVIFDKQENRFLDCNQAVSRVYGYSPEELRYMTPFDLHPKEEFDKVKKQINKRNVDKANTYTHIKKSGEHIQVEILSDEIEYQGKPAWISIIRDVTKNKQFEKELQKAKEAAESANKAKSEFLANMSHEIRTPLNAIIGMTEIIMESELDSEQKGYLEVVQRSSEGLLGLLNDILDFSKIEAGQMELETIEFNLLNLVENTTEMFSVKAFDKGIELLCYVAPDCPKLLMGDPTKLRQIMVNLLGNAIKFTEEGEIALTIKAVDKNKAAPQTVALEFTVSDTGVGISQKNIGKIFDKFSQEDTSTTRRFGGSGLGLAISKSLIEMMSGELSLESEPSEGSVFTFTLEFEVSDRQESSVTYGYRDFKHVSVLVVDDNETNRFILNKTLTTWGFKVTETSSGRHALSVLQQAKNRANPYDIIILDYQMPEMDGLEVAKRIRQTPNFDQSKIIVLSSAGSISRRGIERLHISEFMNKPVKQSALHDTMLSLLRIPQQKANRPKVVVPDTSSLPQAARKKILLVEDNIDNQGLAKTILEKAHFEVDIAKNGKIGVEMAQGFRYDLILMDIYMPILDGLKATQQIREWENSTDQERVPIVALTAHAVQGYREKCLAHGMDDYLTKPIHRKELLRMINKWIDARPAVLVVDDSEDNRNLLLHQLNKHSDFKIITAHNGKEAIDIFQKQSLALVLMDMEMPVMNGYEAVKKIRAIENGVSVPIIALTAHRDEKEIRKCMNAGCNAFLSKPVRSAELSESIQSFLD